MRRNRSEKSWPTPEMKIPVTNDENYLLLGALFNVLVIAIEFHSRCDFVPSKVQIGHEMMKTILIALKLTK